MQLRRIAARVRAAHASRPCFVPSRYLPVHIDPANRANPYLLSQTLLYDDGVVSVKCEKGFQWDGASIPYWWPVAPWVVTLLLHYVWPGPAAWAMTLLLLLYTLRLLPWMQKIGRHVRAACVHDKLYRSQKVYRAIADAILLAIMQYDKVPLDIRWQIYLNVRLFGGRAYRKASATGASAETVRYLL